jgi:hypothetical protein
MSRIIQYLVVIVSLCLVAGQPVRAGDTLQFHPPDSAKFRVTATTVRVSERGSLGNRTDTTVTVTECSIKKGAEGWVLETELQSMSIRPGSDSLQNSLSHLLIGIRTLLYINETGKAIRVTGYEPLTARLDSVASPTVQAVLKQVLSPTSLAAKEMNDWDLRIKNLVGRPVHKGLVEHNSSEVELKDGSPWSLVTANRFEDTVRIDGVLCQKVSLFADSDPRRLAESLGKTVAEIGSLFKLSDSVLTAMENQTRTYHSRLTLTVEVGTLLERAEHSERLVTLAVPGKDGKDSIRRTQETVEKEIAYH